MQGLHIFNDLPGSPVFGVFDALEFLPVLHELQGLQGLQVLPDLQGFQVLQGLQELPFLPGLGGFEVRPVSPGAATRPRLGTTLLFFSYYFVYWHVNGILALAAAYPALDHAPAQGSTTTASMSARTAVTMAAQP